MDTKEGSDTTHFFAYQGFEVVGQSDLYGSGYSDVIMERTYPLGT